MWKAVLKGLILAAIFGGAQGAQANLQIRGQLVNWSNVGAIVSNTNSQEWVIQFADILRPETRKQMTALKLEVLRYLPPNAFIVRGSESAAQNVKSQRVLGVSAWRPAWKLENSLASKLTARPFMNESEKHRPLHIWVMAFDEPSALRLESQMRGLGFAVSRDGRLFDAVLSVDQILKIADLPGVENIEETPQIENFSMPIEVDSPNTMAPGKGDYSDVTGFETGTKVMNFDAAWVLGMNGSGQIVSYADTGLDMGFVDKVSRDFAGAIRQGHVLGVGAKDWSDPMGHGTHVAGSIAGRGVFSGGLFRGGAYGAELVPQGLWSPLIENLSLPPKLDKLFQPAMAAGARLHSNSWGSPRNLGAYDSMAVQVDDFVWKNPEFLPIFAAGNSGVDMNKDGVIDLGSISSPGTSKNSLTVGASENFNLTGGIQNKVSDLRGAKDVWPTEPIWSSKLSDDIDGISLFSSRGPTSDGRIKPEIVAPGTNILSAKSHVTGASDLWGAYNSDYVYSGGTSMATPLAAGAAAIAREALLKNHQLATPSAALVKAYMMHSSVDMYPGQYGEGTPTQELRHRPEPNQGYGRTDVSLIVDSSHQVVVQDNKMGLGAGEVAEYHLNIPAGRHLLVNLVYSDAPGTPAAGKALVNDLDLDVTGPSVVSAPKDRVNNHEIVEVASAPGGQYVIRVRAVNIPMGIAGKQPFALVYSAR